MPDSAETPAESIALRVEPEAGSVRAARRSVRELLLRHRFGEPVVEGVLLALDEVLMNACTHAASSACGEPVDLAAAVFSDRLELEVQDRGKFSARDAAHAAALPDEESESGRGLFLVHRTMDRVRFDAREGGGTRVRLTKRR